MISKVVFFCGDRYPYRLDKMNTTTNDVTVLEKWYSDKRDTNITFEERTHKYTILTDPGTNYTSVTTFINTLFDAFDADKQIDKMMKKPEWNPTHKYWGMTPKEIKQLWRQNGKNASDAGTELHFQIECFMNNSALKKGYSHKDLLDHYKENRIDSVLEEKEWKHFLSFIKKFPSFKPYRTEWKVYHEDWKISGSIDMVYLNKDGTLSIYDWKRVKEIEEINKWNKFACSPLIPEIPDTNFYHYSLQLNIYKTILEEKYGKKVSALYLVGLHPDNPSYHLVKVPFLEEEIAKLFSC